MTRRWMVATCLVAASCADGPPPPAAIDMGHEPCAHCRMVIVSQATAAQVAAPGEEPRMFDDMGCLRDFLRGARLPSGARVYVTDHRTGAWVDANHALFTTTTVSTPMGSGLLAHADAASRDADPAARGGSPVAAGTILIGPERSTTP